MTVGTWIAKNVWYPINYRIISRGEVRINSYVDADVAWIQIGHILFDDHTLIVLLKVDLDL